MLPCKCSTLFVRDFAALFRQVCHITNQCNSGAFFGLVSHIAKPRKQMLE